MDDRPLALIVEVETVDDDFHCPPSPSPSPSP